MSKATVYTRTDGGLLVPRVADENERYRGAPAPHVSRDFLDALDRFGRDRGAEYRLMWNPAEGLYSIAERTGETWVDFWIIFDHASDGEKRVYRQPTGEVLEELRLADALERYGDMDVDEAYVRRERERMLRNDEILEDLREKKDAEFDQAVADDVIGRKRLKAIRDYGHANGHRAFFPTS